MVEESKVKKLAILVGGGPAPGINSVIHAVVMEAYRNHCEVIGICDGFKYLMAGKIVGKALTPKDVAFIYAQRWFYTAYIACKSHENKR